MNSLLKDGFDISCLHLGSLLLEVFWGTCHPFDLILEIPNDPCVMVQQTLVEYQRWLLIRYINFIRPSIF